MGMATNQPSVVDGGAFTVRRTVWIAARFGRAVFDGPGAAAHGMAMPAGAP
jgi:hypothetical protein